MILQHQREQGNIAKITNCIIVSLLLLVDLLYVVGEELLEAAQSGKEDSEHVVERLQELVNSSVGGLEVTAAV